MTHTVLIVDDRTSGRTAMEALVSSLGYHVETARDGLEALARIRLGVDLVLLDLVMPGMDGFEVTSRIRYEYDHASLPIIVVSGLGERDDRVRALELGANDFVTKPIDPLELRVRMRTLLEMKAAGDALRRQQAHLEERVEERTRALRQALDDLVEATRRTEAAHRDTLYRLALAAEFKDEDTAAHLQRISSYCRLLGEKLRLAPGEIEVLTLAAPMHDVGKIGVPDSVLLKPGRLDDDEWVLMRQHPLIGGRLLANSGSRLLQMGEVIALHHHEKWDGSGYPHGRSGEDIHIWGRICAVADVFDALTSVRPYKRALTVEEAVGVMREGRGAHFDPHVLDLFLDHLPEVRTIHAAA